MALAKYFSKDLLAINRLINTDQSVFEDILNNRTVALAFDENAINSFEGTCGLELIVRLLARFYPKISIVDLTEENDEKQKELINLANTINGNIEIVTKTGNEDIFILAGFSEKQIITKGFQINFGSDNWISKYSISTIQSFGDSLNPLGCSMSACITVSNAFRNLFSEYVEHTIDEEVNFSTFSLDSEWKENPPFKEVIFDDVVIGGVGAIGNGLIWSLSQIEQLKGNLILVDDETISLSNLQRYVLFVEDDEKKEKVKVAREFFKQKNLKVDTCKGEWKDYIEKRISWKIDCVAVGIDNEKDRIGIQSTLPRIIFNAFTEPELIGITRHLNFETDPCLACSYIPTTEGKNKTEEIAENCRIPDKVDMVKQYYNFNASVDENIQGYSASLLQEISHANKIPIENLTQYSGKKLDEFYSDFICGGVILNLSADKTEIKEVDAPLAFQSAMAGILLATELVKYHMDSELAKVARTDFYHLSPLSELNPYHRELAKDSTGRCLCRDDVFIKRYNEKWKKPRAEKLIINMDQES
ncbi:E2 ligase fold family C protein [Draconibacterium sediminis]|uniref:E2 ligase fold family C protein n=1 Tax=Draconibacterium sediminis TaxID=1544798 RepID=UPI0026ED49B0|nr:E2 ligase fold family C protein [Draconibacterium sediminis]